MLPSWTIYVKFKSFNLILGFLGNLNMPGSDQVGHEPIVVRRLSIYSFLAGKSQKFLYFVSKKNP